MLVGDRLRKVRIKNGLTQEELGRLIGVSKSTICTYENETRSPSLESVLDLVYALGVSADYLLGSENIIKTTVNNKQKYYTMTKEEILFINELKKDKMLYSILIDDPKRGSELIKRKIG